MPNIGKDDHPKLWSLIFVLIIALTFCCFVMGQGLNSGTSVFLAGQGYGASLAGVLALVFSVFRQVGVSCLVMYFFRV